MPIRVNFVYEWPPGVTPIYFHEWIESLPPNDQINAKLSVERQSEIRSKYVESGTMKMGRLSPTASFYEWKDHDSFETNKPSDPEWGIFWNRYITETQTIFTMVTEEV